MKRLLSLTAALMALVMMMTLGACGGGEETAPAENGEETTQSETAEPADTEGTGVDLEALNTQMQSDNSISDSVPLTADSLTKGYGIDAAQAKAFAGFSATSGAAFPQEVVMVEAMDETAAADVKTKLENHLQSIADQAASYDPDSLELAENCAVVQNGVYVGMFFSEHYDAMVSSFESALG